MCCVWSRGNTPVLYAAFFDYSFFRLQTNSSHSFLIGRTNSVPIKKEWEEFVCNRKKLNIRQVCFLSTKHNTYSRCISLTFAGAEEPLMLFSVNRCIRTSMDAVKRVIVAALQHSLRLLRAQVSRLEFRLRVEEPHGLVAVLLRDGEPLVKVFLSNMWTRNRADSEV
ncbi:hypothetical protein EYF80_044556 [Liparis tanakae]|uniref:Uncharacterized protein n=1 Tax=Liparis tanakae TaxID=230148 RepID=A0A4Z2FY25_9TELE|nr:hypothetical protein EYF80_044556 [Liparis tanakae]